MLLYFKPKNTGMNFENIKIKNDKYIFKKKFK